MAGLAERIHVILATAHDYENTDPLMRPELNQKKIEAMTNARNKGEDINVPFQQGVELGIAFRETNNRRKINKTN